MSKFEALTEERKTEVMVDMLHNRLEENFRNEADAEEMMKFIKEKLQREYKLLGVNLTDAKKHMKKSPETVLEIRKLLALGYNYSQIARNLGISRGTVVRVAEKSRYMQ